MIYISVDVYLNRFEFLPRFDWDTVYRKPSLEVAPTT